MRLGLRVWSLGFRVQLRLNPEPGAKTLSLTLAQASMEAQNGPLKDQRPFERCLGGFPYEPLSIVGGTKRAVRVDIEVSVVV